MKGQDSYQAAHVFHVSPMSELSPKTHRFLLFMTIFMGVLILIGFGFLAYTIASRAGVIASDFVQEISPNETPIAAPAGTVATLPEGAVIQNVVADSGRLAIWYRPAAGGDQVLIVDLESGAMVGEIGVGQDVQPTPPVQPAPGQIAPPLAD